VTDVGSTRVLRLSNRYRPAAADPERTFVAFSCGVLAILSSICFHDHFTRALREVHMKKQSTNSHMPKPCAAAAAGSHALLA
jgi:hypothetical protein